MTTSPTGFRAVLSIRDFRTLVAARLVSMLGDSAAFLAVTVLVYQRTHSSLLASATFAIAFVPYLFGGSLLSASIDRFPPRALVVATDLAGAACVAVLTLPGVPIGLIFVALFAIGSVAPVRSASIDTLTAELLTGELYVTGRSLQRLISQVSQLAGIGLGGVLIAPFGVRGALLIDLGTFLLSALVIRIGTSARPRRADPVETPTNLVADSLAGIRLVWRDRSIRQLLLLAWLVPFVAVAPEALAAPSVAAAGRAPGLVGLWLVAIPVGMIVGNLAVVWLPGQQWRRPALFPLALSVPVLLACFALRPPFELALVLLVCSGLVECYALELDKQLRDAIPLDLRGRAFAVNSTGLMVSQGLGFVFAGLLGQFMPPWTAIATAGGIGILVVGWLWLTRARVSASASTRARARASTRARAGAGAGASVSTRARASTHTKPDTDPASSRKTDISAVGPWVPDG